MASVRIDHIFTMNSLILKNQNLYVAFIDLKKDFGFRGVTISHGTLSRVRTWFHDSAGDIDFYEMSLSQS